uniref:Immunoglobulin V-set domain-containing protein n=1 Tax=Anolis carolinensis TaxID=28377 RepID=A0A803TD54_ANOCA
RGALNAISCFLAGGWTGWPVRSLPTLLYYDSMTTLTITAQETSITMKPPRPVEGGKVYLIPQDLSPAPVLCRWFRGESIENNTIAIFYFYPHPYIWDATAFTGREIMKSNCSLEIIDLNYNDTANYTVLIEGLMGSRVGTVELVIEGRSLIYLCMYLFIYSFYILPF